VLYHAAMVDTIHRVRNVQLCILRADENRQISTLNNRTGFQNITISCYITIVQDNY